MRRYPTLWRLTDLLDCTRRAAVAVDDTYLPARPMGLASLSNRLWCAYVVLTGRADAVMWPEDEWRAAGLHAAALLKEKGPE